MKTELVSIVFDRKKTEAKKGFGAVEILIYFSRTERKYVSLGKATSDTLQNFVGRKEVAEKVQQYKNIVTAMTVLNDPMTIHNFCKRAGIAEKTAAPSPKKEEEKKGDAMAKVMEKDFIEYVINEVEKEDIAAGTRKHRLVLIAALQRFGKLATFADLTPGNILAFDEWLHDGTRSDASIFTNYHKKLHHYIRVLRMCGEIKSDPYEQVQIKHGKFNERQPLTEQELIMIRDAKLTGKLDRVRDLFIFSAYTGLAYCDMASFNFGENAEKVGDLYYIDGSRLKTGTKFFTPILRPAMDVLVKYDYKLPVITNQKMNDYLKVIQLQLGIHKNLTCHVARHSFATLALAHDVPIENVARMLGHTDIKTTQIYAKVLKTTIERHSMSLASAIQ